MSMINNGQVFPYSCPAETEIPPWAWQNNANGALSVGQVSVPVPLVCQLEYHALTHDLISQVSQRVREQRRHLVVFLVDDRLAYLDGHD